MDAGKTRQGQNRRQNIFNRELFVCPGGLDIIKLTKTPLIYSVSRFNLGGVRALFGGAKPTKAHPWRRDWSGIIYSAIFKAGKSA